MFRLVRYFSLTSLVAFLIVTTILGILYRQQAVEDLVAMGEQQNVALAQIVSSTLIAQIDPLLDTPVDQGGPEIAMLRAAAADLLRNSPVVKIKIYNLNGLTVFSSDPAQIGEDKRSNAGYQRAYTGGVVSELSHRDSFSAFEGEIVDRDLISSYVPIRSAPDGPVIGVFEIYNDLTPLLEQINRTQLIVVVELVVMLLLLYGALFLIVRRADTIIKQQRESLIRTAEDLRAAKDIAEAAMAARNLAISVVTHELRTPMTAVKGYTDLMALGAGGSLSADQRSFLEVIRANMERMERLAADLGESVALEAGQIRLVPENLAVKTLVEEAIRSVENQIEDQEHRLILEMPTNLPPVRGDRTRLVQILTNLISNACKYTPPGGIITISASTQDDFVCLEVRDNGLGIDEAEQARIFQQFFRSTDTAIQGVPGSGLGLYITRRLVELQSGSIWFTSSLRKGTSFFFTIPTVNSLALNDGKTPTESISSLQPQKQ